MGQMIRYLLAKPFELLMRASYKIHLTLDGNSDWYCMRQDELDFIVDEAISEGSFSVISMDSDFVCECD
jgi:hypothetical protein